MVYKVDVEKAKRTAQRLQEESQKTLIPLWTPKEGRNTLRFLPPWSSDGDIGYETKFHWNIGPEHKAMPCPRVVDKECPICDFTRELRKVKNPLANEISAKKRIYYNVIIREEESKGVQLYASGIRIYENVLSYLYDEEWGDITDIQSGRDMILERIGQGKEDTQYTLKPKSSPSQLHTDQKTIDAWLDEMYDLDNFLIYPEPQELVKLVDILQHDHHYSLKNVPEQKQIASNHTEKQEVKPETNKHEEMINKLKAEINSLTSGAIKLKS